MMMVMLLMSMMMMMMLLLLVDLVHLPSCYVYLLSIYQINDLSSCSIVNKEVDDSTNDDGTNGDNINNDSTNDDELMMMLMIKLSEACN